LLPSGSRRGSIIGTPPPIDSFFWRTGDVLQAGVVYAGSALGLAISGFATLNLAFTGIWIWLAAALARDYKTQSRRRTRERVQELTHA
jgi:hypothetical protein